MSNRCEIVFSGVGGQGLISAGNVLCMSAAVFAGKQVALSSEYGIETRGTFTKSDVIISEDPIYYPEIQRPRLVLALAQVAYDRYADMQESDCTLIYDSNVIVPREDAKTHQVGVPFSTVRSNEKSASLNMVALGFVVAMEKMVSQENVKSALEALYGERKSVYERNYTAFCLGIELFEEVGKHEE